MKVLFIIDTINGSGAERSLVEIASSFKKVKPVFVHIYPGEMLKEHLQKKGIMVYSLNIEEKYGYNKASEELEKIYFKENPDIIHSTLYRSDMIARRMKSKYPKIPLIGSFVNNSYNSLRYVNKPITLRVKLYLSFLQDKITSRKVDFYISNSETIKKAEGNALGIPKEKIKVIYRGRDPKRFENLDKDRVEALRNKLDIGNKKVLLNVSRLIERKGQLDIINIMPSILKVHPETVLIIAGHGTFKHKLEAEIKKLNLESNVILLGRFNQIPELLKISDIFLYPSYAEGLPGALIEAMMASKIIINSDIGENMECVGNDGSISYPVGDIGQLGEYVLQVLKNMTSFDYLGENAHKIALEKFSIEKIAKEYERTYKILVENFNE